MTYSIVARDSSTGELGVAVQSHYFSVGPIVPWAQPGVGAVATQANVEIAYGPRALERLRAGEPPDRALARLVRADSGSAARQVAIVDAGGAVAAHTGSSCIPYAGHVTAEGVSCQANIVASERVWREMLEAYRATSGRLIERLLAALYQRAGTLAPDRPELRLWAALGAAQAGDLEAAARTLTELEPRWLELLRRLPASVAPAAPALLARLRDRT